jgi:flagellar motor switch protein FliG
MAEPREKQMNTGDAKKAATLFILMGEEQAAAILRHLNEAEIEAISREIAKAGPLTS